MLLKDGVIERQGSSEGVINVDCLKTVYGEDICYAADLPYREISFAD